jgi:hypothetical protein
MFGSSWGLLYYVHGQKADVRVDARRVARSSGKAYTLNVIL